MEGIIRYPFYDSYLIQSSCFIVDSTRNGKRIPDALSKTIPVWIAVMNQLILHSHHSNSLQKENLDSSLFAQLNTPPSSISRAEHSQISLLIPGFRQKTLESSIWSKSMTDLLLNFKKPLRPIWVTPDSTLFSRGSPWPSISTLDFYPIILISASRIVVDGVDRQNGFVYIQGAADDEESWAQNLRFQDFWLHKVIFINCSTSKECEEFRDIIVRNHSDTITTKIDTQSEFDWIGDTGIAIGSAVSEEDKTLFDLVVNCGVSIPNKSTKKSLYLSIRPGKQGNEDFGACIPLLLASISIFKQKSILFLCENGRDASVASAIAVLLYRGIFESMICLFINCDGEI